MANVLTPEQIAALLKPKASTSKHEPVDRSGMVYCNFCKGYYNEYHFGEPDGDS